MECIGSAVSSTHIDMASIWGDKADAFRRLNCWPHIEAILTDQRDRPPHLLSHILLEDLGRVNDELKVSLKLYGTPSEQFLLQGKVNLVGFVAEEYQYDVRYIYEIIADAKIAKGIATTVEDEKRLHYQVIAEDMAAKGFSFSEMCRNTLDFIESSED